MTQLTISITELITAIAEENTSLFSNQVPYEAFNADLQDAWENYKGHDYHDGDKPALAPYEYRSDFAESRLTTGYENYSKLIHAFEGAE